MSRKKTALGADYSAFLTEMKVRISAARLSAARAVNRHLVELYWDLGAAILDKQKTHGWGEAVITRPSSAKAERWTYRSSRTSLPTFGMTRRETFATGPRSGSNW